MKTRRLLLLALALLPLSLSHAAPPAANAGAQGVPFDRLQQQIDQLRQRMDALEAAKPAGQNCPAGQFVTGFTSTGTILCATTAGGTPTPPPSPNPIPPAFQAALQQALNGLAAQDRPLQGLTQSFAVGDATLTIQPLRYDLAIGTAQLAQTSATSATIQLAIPSFAIDFDYRLAGGILVPSSSGVVILGATGSTATIGVSVIETASGGRRLGTVTSVSIVLGSQTVSGGDPVLNGVLSSLPLSATLNANLRQFLASEVDAILPALPEF